jgi:dTDP-4-dehydrorhamnose 3,5-epimerase
VDCAFVQDNFSLSAKGVLRGLHFQFPHSQAKLVTVIRGRVLDVVVDLRPDSPTFGEHCAVELSGERKRQLFVPEGFAHAFLTLEEDTLFHYKCSDVYSPDCEHTLLWNDPELGICWPVEDPQVSPKDREGTPLREIRQSILG